MAQIKNPVTIVQSGGTEDWGTVTYLDDNNVEQTAKIQNAYEYSTLGQYSSIQADPLIASNVAIPKGKVTKIALGKSAIFAPYSFMYYGTSLVELSGTENLTEIEDYFLNGCTAFNQSLNLENVTHIGNYFLYACNSFNSSITMPKVTAIGNRFLMACTSYNTAIALPDSLITIGNSFLNGCTTFNKPLTLPNKVKSISEGFLNTCSSFNSALDLGSVEVIGQHFMDGCTAFAQSLTIPGTIPDASNSVGAYFMYNCNNFIGPLVCNAPTKNASLPTSNQTLATQDNAAPMYATGVTLSGPYASIWKNKYSNRTSSPYRNLTVAS